MTRTGLVLQRRPGHDEWTEARYVVGPEGFGMPDLLRMAVAEDGMYECIRLDETFAMICNEDGRTLKLPVSVAIALPRGGTLPIFGQLAVVRIRRHITRDRQRAYIGLREGDVEHIKSAYPWRPVQG